MLTIERITARTIMMNKFNGFVSLLLLLALICPGVHVVTAGNEHYDATGTPLLDGRSFFRLGRHVWGDQSRRQRRNSSSCRQQRRVSLTSATATATISAEAALSQPTTHSKKPLQVIVHKLRQAPAKFRQHLPFFEKLQKPTRVASPAVESTTAMLDLTQPIFDQTVWLQQSGREFVDDPTLVDALAETGLAVVQQTPQDGNPWVEWKVHCTVNENDNYEYDAAIDVWTGSSIQEGYGSVAPWIKTRAIVPLSPQVLVDLMLDSSRVKTYNAWSTGRQDLWTAPSTPTTNNNNNDTRTPITKIVRNQTQPPMGAKPMIATTLLHARPYGNDHASWILVSRAIGGNHFPLDNDASMGVSEMLLGVNVFEAVPGKPHVTRMTALTHVYSKSIPLMLAERLGVKSAIQFVKDMRALGEPSKQKAN